MDRYFGIFGIIAILGIAFLLSNNKKAIDLYEIDGVLTTLPFGKFVCKHASFESTA